MTLDLVAFDPDDTAVRANPWPVFQWLREHAPVYKVPGREMWALSRYRDVEAALRDHATFSSGWAKSHAPLPRPLILHRDPPDHTRLRRQVAPPFARREMLAYEQAIQQHADRFLDAFIEAGECEIIEQFANRLPMTVIATLLGAPLDRVDDLRRWTMAVARFGPGGGRIPLHLRGTEFEHTARRANEDLLTFVEEFVAAHQAAPQDDLTGLMLQMAAAGRIDPDDVIVMCRVLISAGQTTTTNLISNGITILADNPAIWQRVKAQPDLLPAFVEEVLRYEPSVISTERITTRPVTIDGTTLPAGAHVYLLLGAANRDPAEFPNPDTFDLDRYVEDNSRVGLDHFAFGAGIHLCLGAHLARLEARVAFRTLLRRLEWIRVAPDFDREANRMVDCGLPMHGLNILPVQFLAAASG